MPEIDKEEVRELLSKYQCQLNKQLGTQPDKSIDITKPVTKEYVDFKKEYLPKHMGIYEKLCNLSAKYLNLKPDDKQTAQIQENLAICHLSTTPKGVASFAILAPFVLAICGILLTFVFFEGSIFMILFFVFGAAAIYKPIKDIPKFLANGWRMKASSQMVLSIFYVVTYMRHTSNLELAIQFSSRHLLPPLALDFKKILWNVENEIFPSVKDSLDDYLQSWKKWNSEYIEAMHLVESSLYEISESRRITMLEKSLSVMLDGTYEKMLHYAQNLKSPITMLHMLGIILPILGLVVLPLMVSFMEGIKWFHISAIYNILLPIMVLYLGKNILATRPSGYGQTDISSDPDLKKYTKFNLNLGLVKFSIDPIMISIIIGIVFGLIGFSPIILNYAGVEDFGFGGIDEFSVCGQKFCFMEYKPSQTEKDVLGNPVLLGPFGLVASILSVIAVMGLGISIGLYYKLKSVNIIYIRERSKKLEQEFASAIFQLGNRLGDGLPAELAFGKVAGNIDGTVSGKFFTAVARNIGSLGMSVEQAIFDTHHGALRQFPSSLIESSMKVLVESSKKGPMIAAQALMNISRYIKQMHSVEERLKDLLAETISSMKSQIKFLTPVIAAIVIGITSMITAILGKLSVQLAAIGSSGSTAGSTGLLELFKDGLPTYYFQLIVGLYVVQIVYILTVLTNGIENGADELGEKYNLSLNINRGIILYGVLSIAVMIAFNMVALTILSAT